MEQDEPRTRAERSDKGQVRITERDLMIFSWLSMMKAVYEPDLAALIGRMTGSRPGEPAVRALTRRWQAAEVAEARKLIATKPRIVRLLRAGATLVGQEYFRPTAEFTQYHQAEVSRVRLWLETNPSKKHGSVAGWESEREYRQHMTELYDKVKLHEAHVPDGVVTWEDGTKSAIEVERSPKTIDRLRTIIGKLFDVYPEVIYAVTPASIQPAEAPKTVLQQDIQRAVQAAYNQLLKQRKGLGPLHFIAIPEEVS